MSGTSVMNSLRDIGSVRGKAKQVRLEKHMTDNMALREVIKLACDPMITFGVTSKKLLDAGEPGDLEFGQDDFEILRKLSERELSGNSALEVIKQRHKLLNEDSRTVFAHIINKDLRAGFGVSSVNKAIPNFIYVFKTMLAQPFKEKRIEEFPVYVEEKLDGMRVVAVAQKSGVKFFSRTGKPIDTLSHIGEHLSDARGILGMDFVLDGEIVAKSFNDTVSSVRKKGGIAEDAVFHVFDAMPLAVFKGEEIVPVPLEKRMILAAHIAKVANTHKVSKVRAYKVNSIEEVMMINGSVLENGGEGVIVKIPGSFYEKKRSYAWMKIKAAETADLVVTGWFEGEVGKKYENSLGGLIVDNNGVSVRVGGGFSDTQRQEFWDDVVNNEAGNLIGRTIEVGYHEETPDGSLRHPRFERFRDSITGEKE